RQPVPPPAAMTRRLAVGAAIVAYVLGLLVPAAGAQSTTTTLSDLTDVPIIPEPNSGREPEDAGDRGGGLQVLVLVAVVAAIGGGGAYVAWQSKQARSRTGR
ncbi:MAG: hypothetical protein M3Z03_03215, partial [Actinomycetota bacterium]|nr:hypothetical protein [Actinomycetota bacterium]